MDDPSKLALRLRAGTSGTVSNLGFVTADGGTTNGSGGDVLFQGPGVPAAGGQSRLGRGTGSNGDYLGF